MQTFIPIAPHREAGFVHFKDSAKVLDRQRLGKQRVEAYQILQTILGDSQGWKNHPAVKMWVGYKWVLFQYIMDMCDEWISRGYKDSIKSKTHDLDVARGDDCNTIIYQTELFRCVPLWLGKEEFHASHRSNLLRKDPIFYGKYGWTESAFLPYYWPTKDPLLSGK